MRAVDAVLDSTFAAVVFDWDGTAVPDRHADASAVRERVEALCALGVEVVVVSGTHVGNVDGQLGARPQGPGALHLCLNRGSEVFEVGPSGPELVWRREATVAEDGLLDVAAARIVAALAARGLTAEVVSHRLNRRKIDLIPEPQWADPPKARIGALLEAVIERLERAGIPSLVEVVAMALEEARAAGLEDPRVTSDAKHVEVGLTDKADAGRWIADRLARLGVTGGLILVAGDEFGPLGSLPGSDALLLVPALQRAVAVSVGQEPGGVPGGVLRLDGGPTRFLQLLDDQLARHRARRVPWLDADPAWVVELPDAPEMQRAAESIGSLGNGWIGVRGAREEDGPGSNPLVLVNGVYTGPPSWQLLPGPTWTALDITDPGTDRRLLDLRTGVLARCSASPAELRSIRFASCERPRLTALRAEARPSHLALAPVAAPLEASTETEVRGATTVTRTSEAGADAGGAVITVATRDRVDDSGERRMVERLAGWADSTTSSSGVADAAAQLATADTIGFGLLLREHRAGWADRWADAAVTIEGDPHSQLAARFALFHLLATAPDQGEAAVGARGLTGCAYGGHVFWDADVFVLPALAAMRPAAARAMLEYRIRRLPDAMRVAVEEGGAGARFPWEGARDGRDVTPTSLRDHRGQLVPIYTGQHEEHIVADVAWAASEYAAWTGDAAFLEGPGLHLLVETARWWASRIRVERDGRGHLYGVVGPDEYHEIVDDSAFTNVMARWNLRRAAAAVAACGASAGVGADEVAIWHALADGLVDGWDADRGLHEQFSGYWDLEPLLMASVAPPPVAADVVLGPERVRASQIIKQADVLMLHHMVPGEVPPGSLGPTLDFYEPRTAHGSSLSPAIHAALFARAGRPERALELFRMAARLDLDDLTGTTAGGLHLATLGGVWQALASGFLGVRLGEAALGIDPVLPESWTALSLRFRHCGAAVGVRADHDAVTVTTDRPLDVSVAGRPPVTCRSGPTTIPYGRGAR